MTGNKKIVFSGIQPTGEIHIGNYLGAIKNWVELQNNSAYDCIFSIVDLHAITVPQNPKILRQKIMEVSMLYLAAGLDPKKSTIFIQSYVPEHAELTWVLTTLTPLGELQRMTQFKDKAKKQKSILAGLLNYPVLMAADILLYQTEIVPVGEDQIQHVEFARMIAKKFNTSYGKTFKIPEVIVEKDSQRLKGLDNPSKKMSKSAENPNNYIALLDSPEKIREKIKIAVTDSGKEIKYDEKNKPAISNLMTIYSAFSNKTVKEIEGKYKDKGYAEFKKDLAEIIIKGLAPLQKKYKKLEKNPDYVRNVLEQGRKRAQKIASLTMEEVKKATGLI